MSDDKDLSMPKVAEDSINVFLKTAKDLVEDDDALDADDTEQLHWCWEGIHHVLAAKLAHAQLEAHKAANAPASTDDLKRMIEALGDKITAMSGGNGNGASATPAKA